MALTQFTTDISYIAALPDSPTPNGGFTKAQLKAEFDKAGNALKTFINETMITEIEAELALKSSSSEHYNKNDLNSTVDGSSGADKIGITAIDGLSGTTTQAVLESVGESLADIMNLTIDVTKPPSPLAGAKIDGNTDDYTALTNIIAYLKSKGGGTLVFPYTGYECKISDTLYFDFGNILLDIRCDIRLTKTTKSHTIRVHGGYVGDGIKNVTIIGRGNTIYGNGENVTGYTYDLGDTNYTTLNIIRTDDVVVKGLKFVNGLVCSAAINSCRNILVEDCEFNGARHDNGFSIEYSFVGEANYNANDSTTWTNAVIKNCKAIGNADFGITNFMGTNVVFENCMSVDNGNAMTRYGITQFNRGGGYSVEKYNNSDWDSNTRFRNCHAINCIGRGFYLNSNNVHLDSQCMVKNIATTGDTDTYRDYGNGITIHSRRNITVKGKFIDCASCGISQLSDGISANTTIDNLIIDAHIENSGTIAAILNGISNVRIDNLVVKNVTGETTNDGIGLRVINGGAVYNQDGGKLYIENIDIDTTKSSSVFVQYVKNVVIKNALATSPNLKVTPQYGFGIGVTNVDYVEVDNVVCKIGTSTGVIQGIYINTATTSFIGSLWSDATTPVSNSATNKKTSIGYADNVIGNWTPVLGASTTDGTHTYSAQQGRYVKQGNMVTCWFRIILTSKDAAMSGNVLIKGLPFTSANTAGTLFKMDGNVSPSNVTFPTNTTTLISRVSKIATQIEIYGCGTGVAITALTATGIGNTSELIGCVSYEI